MWLLALLTLAGGALRFATLDVQSFWFDEAATVSLVHMDLGGMLSAIPDKESTPPLYYLLAWLWSQAFGSGEVGLRSLSALAGTVTIPAAYLAGAELAGRRAGLVLAALTAFNPLLFWYSQEARAYALAALLTTLALASFARALWRPTRRVLALWALASALALATHYFAAFVIVPMAAWLVVSGLRSGAGRRHLAAALGVLVAALALLPLLLHQRSLDLAAFLREDPLLERFGKAAKQGLLGYDAPLEPLLAAIAAAIAAVGALAALAGGDDRRMASRAGRDVRPAVGRPWDGVTVAAVGIRRRTRGAVIAAVVASAAVALPLLLALAGADYFGTRNLIVAWVPTAAVVAAGLARGRIGLAGAAALCAIGLAAIVGVAVTKTWQRDDWRGAARALPPPRGPRAIIVTPAQGSRQPLTLYTRGLRPLPLHPVVREVALVSVVDRNRGGVHPPSPPRPPTPRIAGFSLVLRRQGAAYTVLLLRAARPSRLEQATLAAFRLLPERTAALLLQRPPSGAAAGALAAEPGRPLSGAAAARARRRSGA